MSSASPTAFLVWAILSVLFLCFLIYHLWSYDRFKCLHWSSGRQPGAFKRVMTYSYLGAVPLFVVYSVATTAIKFKEGFIMTPDKGIIPTPLNLYSPKNHNWIVPLDFVFSFAWALELVTHLEELAFWLYLLHQNPQKEEWFESWEYRLWYLGSILAILGMPLTALVARKDVDNCDAWIFLVGSSGSTTTTICFLYVLWGFPRFIRHVKAEGADPSVVVRLATFYQLNLVRVVFRFLFTVPLFILAIDGITGTTHRINRSLFWTDFLTMIAGIGCFISTTITLLIFFPRSIVKESGYKPKLPTVAGTSPKSPQFTPPPMSTGPFEASSQSRFSPGERGPQGWDEGDDVSMYYQDQAPPYAGVNEVPIDSYASAARAEQGVYQRQPFPHSLSSPQILSPPTSPQQMRVALPPRRRISGIGGDLQRAGLGIPLSPSVGSTSTLSMSVKRAGSPMVQVLEGDGVYQPHTHVVAGPAYDTMYRAATTRAQPRMRPQTTLHPYVMTFTSPIDLADIPPPISNERTI